MSEWTEGEVRVPRAALARVSRAALNVGVATGDAMLCLACAEHGDALMPLPDTVPSHPIAVFTLGRFALVRGGAPLCFHGKSPHKPIELLQALVAHGGRDVHAELLMDSVWPGDESSDRRNLFDNTLHRLRHLLDCDDAVLVADAKLTLNPARCRVDAWDFDRCVGEHSQVPAALPAMKALSLYQGHFLALEAPRHWMHAYRERLRSRFLRLVANEGARLEGEDLWRHAAAWYERGLEIDPLAELLYQRSMACHQARGAVADVLRVYARCREHLRLGLGVAPSQATESMRHTAGVAGMQGAGIAIARLPP